MSDLYHTAQDIWYITRDKYMYRERVFAEEENGVCSAVALAQRDLETMDHTKLIFFY